MLDFIKNFNLFLSACETGNIDYVNLALDNEEIRANAALCNNSALYGAAFNGHLQVVNRLLELENVRANVTADDNAVFRGASSNGQYAVVTRLLQERNVTDYLKQQRQNSTQEPQAFFDEAEKRRFSRHKDFFKEIDEQCMARIVAAQCLYLNSVDEHAVEKLSSNEHNEAIHTRPIENQILTYLYHDVLCGKSACLERKKEDSFFKCPVISQFRDDAISPIVAAHILFNKFDGIESQFLANQLAPGETVTTTSSKYITNHILTFAYHDVLCGKSACLEREKEDSFFKCPIISQFRDDAIGAKARAQSKLGTQATTSTSTNSSTQPSKKARHN